MNALSLDIRVKHEYDKMNSDFERERHATILPENRERYNKMVSRAYASYLDSFVPNRKTALKY